MTDNLWLNQFEMDLNDSFVADLPDELGTVESEGDQSGCNVEQPGQDTPLLDLSLGNWCESCHKLQEELNKVKSDHALNFKILKEKIIPTDKLIKRYSSKCQEYDSQTKIQEETTRKLEKVQRDCDMMATKLRATLEEVEPVKKLNERLEQRKEDYKQQVQTLEDKWKALESTNRQISAAHRDREKDWDKMEEECKTARLRVKSLETEVKKKDNIIKKIQDELQAKKTELTNHRQKRQKLSIQVDRLTKKLLRYQEVVNLHGLSHEVRRKGGRQSCESSVVSHNLSEDWNWCPDSGSDSEDLHHIFHEMGVFDRDDAHDPIPQALSPLPPSPAPRRTLDSQGDEDVEKADENTKRNEPLTDENETKKKKVPTATLR